MDDYHLLAGSPCIDAGNPDSSPDPDGTIADIGAFYFHQGIPAVPQAIDDLVIMGSGNSAALVWSPVVTDTTGNPIDISYYVVYMSLEEPLFGYGWRQSKVISVQRNPTMYWAEGKDEKDIHNVLLQVALPVKQRLLSIADLPSLLHEEAVLLDRENKALNVMIQALETGGPSRDADTPFSKN